MSNKNLKGLEARINYFFKDDNLLRQAMTHSSFANEHRLNRFVSNERLEFLGDAVLEIVVSEYLYINYEKMPEGEMSRRRASIVCEPTLAFCSKDIDLGSYLLMGKGEEMTGGRYRDSIISDAMEALIGALYLDGGFTSAKEFIYKFILNDIDNKQLFFDSKTILQEMVQSVTKEVISYRLVNEEGPDHNKTFSVEVALGDNVIGVGLGRSKKLAEQMAAYNGIIKLRSEASQNMTEPRKD